MNIWTSENIIKYWIGTSSTARGEWSTRNGEPAIRVQPNNFYKSGNYVKIFEQEFLPNTQYVINLYMDTDDVVYNGTNVQGGVIVYYTDGSSKVLAPTGSHTSPKGWQQQYFITDASKSVHYISSYYYTSIPVYYRWDSYITPVLNPSLNKEGVFNSGNMVNLFKDGSASITSGGLIANSFYEF